MKLSEMKLNDGRHGLPKNPRLIKDERFKALCESIKTNPEFMRARPIIINEDGVILGGNMRYRACKENKMKDIPADWVQVATGWSLEKQKRFIIMDNRGFGEDDETELKTWDFDDLLKGGYIGKLLEQAEKDEKEIIKNSITTQPEYKKEYDQAEKRADAISEKLRQIQRSEPKALLRSKAIIISSSCNQILCIDDNLKDFLDELQRYVDAGEDSPLEKILNSVHKL